MSLNTKARHAELHAVAMTLVAKVGIVNYHDMDDATRKATRQRWMADLQDQTGCAYETARRHVAKALRRHRAPDITPPDAWGGDRRSDSSEAHAAHQRPAPATGESE